MKEELVEFCKNNGLPASGGKVELTERIAYFLDTGKVKEVSKTKRAIVEVGTLSEDTIIENNIVCSEKHRAFFKEKTGKSFSFNVQFQKWLTSKIIRAEVWMMLLNVGNTKRACKGIISMKSRT
ncbi:DUF6434 domain-containing protein [Pseudobutyrivibrio ruminis]|uniref:DUF6434 domain-containing protein n=1 Tax=Pseudobutyrivibrio ruminis TaxID=46206 RepID=UPI002FE5B97F